MSDNPHAVNCGHCKKEFDRSKCAWGGCFKCKLTFCMNCIDAHEHLYSKYVITSPQWIVNLFNHLKNEDDANNLTL